MPSIYKVVGITDDVTTCEHCGKKNLKKTVVLRDRESGDEIFVGTSCAAMMLGWTERSPVAQYNRAYAEVMKARDEVMQRAVVQASTLMPTVDATLKLLDNYGRFQIFLDDVSIRRFALNGSLNPSTSELASWAEDALAAWRKKRAEEIAVQMGIPPRPA